MSEKKYDETNLEDLINKLRLRGFDQKGIALRIGLDDPQILSDALRGKQKGRINSIVESIHSEFEYDLNVKSTSVTMKTLNEKLDKIIKGLNIE